MEIMCTLLSVWNTEYGLLVSGNCLACEGPYGVGAVQGSCLVVLSVCSLKGVWGQASYFLPFRTETWNIACSHSNKQGSMELNQRVSMYKNVGNWRCYKVSQNAGPEFFYGTIGTLGLKERGREPSEPIHVNMILKSTEIHVSLIKS